MRQRMQCTQHPATPCRRRLYVRAQVDVTARVRLERRLADVMEAEHKLLENIFPR